MPGLSLTGWQAPAAQFAASVASAPATAPETTTEPALDCCVYATCTDNNAPTLTIWKIAKPRHIHARHRTLIHILTRVNEGGDLVPVPNVTITLGRYTRTTDQDDDTTIIANLARPAATTSPRPAAAPTQRP